MDLLGTYNYYNTEFADPRTNNWLLVSSPIPILLITSLYLYFVLDYGPKYMKNKKPYSFKILIYFYNVFQIIINLYILYRVLEAGWYEDGFMYCTKLDYSFNTNPMKMANVVWYGFLLKVFDYVETIIFVLRKKDRQVSFLHLYHHTTTVFMSWLTVKYFPNGHAVTIGSVNGVIHVIMYTYYLLSSCGPEIQKTLGNFKRMVTISQMVQFVIQIIYMMQAFIPGCPGTRIAAIIMIPDLLINLCLFYNFYRDTYILTKDVKKK